MTTRASATDPFARLRDPARVATVRALTLHDRRADAALDRLTRLAARIVGAPTALVNIVEADRQVTRSAFGPPGRFHRGDEAPLPDSMCAIAVNTGLPFVVADARHDARTAGMSCVAGGVVAYAGIPLTLSSGHSLGTLCVVDDQPREWTEEELALLKDLAAAAITELELRAATQAAEARAAAEANARRLEAVQRIVDVALNHATLDATLDAILGCLRQLLRADTATVLLADAAGAALQVRASVGLEAEVDAQVSVPIGQGISGRIAASREPTIVPDVAAADPVSPFLRQRIHSLLGAPLLLHGQLLGVVHVGTAEPRAFDEDDVRLLELAAGRIAAAIERARLFDAERDARLAAEAANRAKSGFLAVMSHELRTPLNAIGGYVGLLEDGIAGPVTQEQAAMLARIDVGRRQLTHVIDDILQFVELERHAPPTRAALAPLATVLDTVAADIDRRAATCGMSFERRGCAIPPELQVARAPVEDVLRRVVDNALKFTPRGGRVALECAMRDDTVVVVVCDSGPGIPDDRMASVFEPFGRVDSTYRRSHDGAGLGLPIARGRARQLGGDLVVESAPSGGTRVALTLPRAALLRIAPPRAAEGAAEGAGPGTAPAGPPGA